jgi:hypothetical protein
MCTICPKCAAFRRSRPLRPRSIHDGLIYVSTMEDWGGALSHGAATCPGEAGEPFRSRLSIGSAPPPRQHRAGPRFPQCVWRCEPVRMPRNEALVAAHRGDVGTKRLIDAHPLYGKSPGAPCAGGRFE